MRLLMVSLVARVTARNLHNNMLGCLLLSGKWFLQHGLECIMLVTLA